MSVFPQKGTSDNSGIGSGCIRILYKSTDRVIAAKVFLKSDFSLIKLTI